MLFELNHPIMVLAFANNAFAHATYSMVRAINAWSDSSPHKVKYTVIVEVHVRQDFKFDWSNTVPWPGIMPHIPLIHPHVFLTTSYTPLPLADTPTDEISIVHYNADHLDQMITLQCQDTLSLLDTHAWHVTANSTPQPPVVHLGNVCLECGKFISMIVTPPTMTTLPASPSTLSDEEFDWFAMDEPIYIYISAGDEFDKLPWRISLLCPLQMTYLLLME